MAENVLSLCRDINEQIQEGKWILNRINLEKSMARHIIIKHLNTEDKVKILKVAEGYLSIGKNPIWMKQISL